jgi:hypothetical protein
VGKSRFLDSPNVAAASIRGQFTVGVKVPLTFGKENVIIKTSTGML